MLIVIASSFECISLGRSEMSRSPVIVEYNNRLLVAIKGAYAP